MPFGDRCRPQNKSRTQERSKLLIELPCMWLNTGELHLSGSPIIRIGLALQVNLRRILQNYLVLKLPDIRSSTVQCYGF